MVGPVDRIVLVDVRNPEEWQICRLDGATLIPLPELTSRVHELDSADEIVAYCKVVVAGRGPERSVLLIA